MTYSITPKGRLVIGKYAPFSPEETERIFEDLKQLTQLKVHGYRMTMDPDTKVRFGCMSMTVADINAFYEEYRDGTWKQTKLGPWHVKETFRRGDTFKNEDGFTITLCQVGPAILQLISFPDANRWSGTTVKSEPEGIAPEKVAELMGNRVEEFTYVEPT